MEKVTDIPTKTKYHHGDLKEALIAAVRQLVIEKGAENFTLADACRLAGVSTAAPYRHFQDREEILTLIVSRAFDTLAEKVATAIGQFEEGSIEAIIAAGKAYVKFAVEQEAIFRLMFGQSPALKDYPVVKECGRDCFAQLIAEIEKCCVKNNIEGDALQIGITLWTFTHGAAALLIDNEYSMVVHDFDISYIDKMIENTTPTILQSKIRQ